MPLQVWAATTVSLALQAPAPSRALTGLLFAADTVKGAPIAARWPGSSAVEELARFQQHMSQYATFFADLCLQEQAFATQRPSTLAAVIAHATRRACYVRPLWRTELSATTGYGHSMVAGSVARSGSGGSSQAEGQEEGQEGGQQSTDFRLLLRRVWRLFRNAHPNAFNTTVDRNCDSAERAAAAVAVARVQEEQEAASKAAAKEAAQRIPESSTGSEHSDEDSCSDGGDGVNSGDEETARSPAAGKQPAAGPDSESPRSVADALTFGTVNVPGAKKQLLRHRGGAMIAKVDGADAQQQQAI